MLRSLYAGISGLRSHQTMLDVTGNNISNVNTIGFKAGSVQFQDTLSQIVQNSRAPQPEAGGTNAAQVGLGTQVAGIRTNFAQGSAQATGVATDLMVAGDGFFVVRSGAETLYTRNGAFSFDAAGRMVTVDGSLVQGWTAVDGQIGTGRPIGDISLPVGATSAAVATGGAQAAGNLPSEVAVGEQLVRDITVYDAVGASRQLALTFTRTAGGWDVTDGTATTSLAFTDGKLTGPAAITSGGVTIDLSALTGFADLRTVALTGQDGRASGSLVSYTISADGSLIGTFSNGASEVLAQVALASFDNPEGLEKAGSSQYRAGANSGAAAVGAAGVDGMGDLVSGALEMSNVDLSQEFTNLIVAQRGFQANARIITTSDEVLQELTNLKR
ncbi:flagellar hook protein FlgE [Microbacterium sp. zg.Y1090]|uniref:flagellar hook protein FlgE n=1 Tax=Microbacterium TaxID=33882 RepID=UPI00214ABC5A|nr:MULTISPECIES: flagellar hook protein FlgE [unclassified Microbacterium]MCR2813985.1 flagellar hook protein FlgE [Microbacterium sp. zg.Y1084]MCR2819259.1 flagellar hook protein FlgE [Microbacterium sp. zg.Y1090]MDL5487176.1 flagellar hook protein FlgE [Microbacterium sp. zg-Y1211]WIM28241.1 flagellar hook protein FlgE [Microbacterium sp. zg-Y1090]